MKKSIIITSVFTAIMTVSFCAFAQSGPQRKGERGKRAPHFEQLKQELNLTPAQEVKITKLREDFRAECRSIREQNQGQGKRGQCSLAREEFKAEMEKVLTPEQRKIAQESREKRRANRGDGMRKRDGKGPRSAECPQDGTRQRGEGQGKRAN